MKLAEYAEMTPDGRIMKGLPKMVEEEGPFVTRLVVQYHSKRTPHWDLRIVDPKLGGALSWAIPKRKFPEEGEKLLAVQTPLHANEYLDFEGELEDNKGTVIKVMDEKAIISYIRPNAVKFSVPYKGKMRTYVLVRKLGGDPSTWFFMLSTPKEKYPLNFKDWSG